jgi:hypothetical protein
MSSLSVCVLGDSVVEKWGHGCPSLLGALKHQYSQVDFEVFNHGAASSRVGNALMRVSQEFRDEQGLHPSVASRGPKIVVLESMAYTHRADGPEGMAEYRDLLRRVADEVRATTDAQFLFCLSLPPHRDRFLENDVWFSNTSRSTRLRFADDVLLYLDEARRIAQDEMWPLADVPAELAKALAAGQNPRRFVNQNDSLHPSSTGYELMASVITRAVDFHRMVDSH